MSQLGAIEVSLICERLDGKSLARVRLLNKLWSQVASSLEVRKARFVNEWGVAKVLGEPRRSSNLLEVANFNNFVYCHDLSKGDTLAKLAVKYKTSVIVLKILNGLSSDHALNTRSRIFVPVESESVIFSKTVAIQYSKEAKRECIVVLEASQLNLLYGRVPESLVCNRKSRSLISAQKRLIDMFSTKFHIDEKMAHCYLVLYKWDVWRAMQKFEQDVRWEEEFYKRCEHKSYHI